MHLASEVAAQIFNKNFQVATLVFDFPEYLWSKVFVSTHVSIYAGAESVTTNYTIFTLVVQII